MKWKFHVRCGRGEKLEKFSKIYLFSYNIYEKIEKLKNQYKIGIVLSRFLITAKEGEELINYYKVYAEILQKY